MGRYRMKTKRNPAFRASITIAVLATFASCSIGLTPDTTGPGEDIARLDEVIGVSARSAAAAGEALVSAANSVRTSTTYNFDAATNHQLRMETEVNNTSGGASMVYTRNGKQITDWRNIKTQERQLTNVFRDALPSGYKTIATEFNGTLESF